jgi:hypothetical protein
VSWGIFLAFLALYAVTLLPDVLPADSGEFQWVAATADVAHPPGYPLYTVLGWLFSRLPLGPTPAWRVNLLSAVTAAATVALVFSVAWKITRSVLGGLAAALTLGSATTFWATATKASIRPLTAFFTVLCIHALVRHAAESSTDTRPTLPMDVGPTSDVEVRPAELGVGPEDHGQKQPKTGPGGDRYLVLFSLVFALGVTHHPSLVFPGGVFVLYLVLVDPALLRQPSRWLKPLAALLPGLLVWIYLPLRGAPNLATPSGFLNHVLARGFRGDMFALSLPDRLVLLPTLLRFQFHRGLLAGMLLGASLLLWRRRKLALLLVGSFLVHTAVTLTYDAPQTVEYEMPAYVSLALLMGVAVGTVTKLRTWASAGNRGGGVLSVIGGAVGAAFLLAALVNLVGHLPSYRGLSRSHDTRSYVKTVLRDAPEGAVILSNWHWFTPLRYVQQIEGVRPDVTLEYVAPRGEPLAQTWVQRIEAHIAESPVVVARAFEHAYTALPYAFEPLGEAFLVRPEPRTAVPADMTALDTTLGAQIEMLGYRLACDETRPAQPLTVELAWSPLAAPQGEIALFAQLIGPDGELWSTAEDPRHAPDTLSTGEVVVERFVVYPRLHAPPGAYSLVVGAYASGTSSQGRFKTPDGDDVIRLETVGLKPSRTRPMTEHPRFVRFASGPTLIGVDYETASEGGARVYVHWAGPGRPARVELLGEDGAPIGASRVPALKRGQYASIAVDGPGIPSRLTVLEDGRARRWRLLFASPIRLPVPKPGERYVPFGDAMVLTRASGPPADLEPGAEATLSLRFHSQRSLERDYIVSTSLTGLNDDGTWAWRASHDTVPALGAIPTLKWIRGSSVLDPHRMDVPPDAPDVPVVGSLLIYDHFTQRSLPSLDARQAPAVDLGMWRVSE